MSTKPFPSWCTTWCFILKEETSKEGRAWLVTLGCGLTAAGSPCAAWAPGLSKEHAAPALPVLGPKGAHGITSAVLWPMYDEESERWPQLHQQPPTYMHPLSGPILMVRLWMLNTEILLASGTWLQAEGKGDSLSWKLTICSNLRGRWLKYY